MVYVFTVVDAADVGCVPTASLRFLSVNVPIDAWFAGTLPVVTFTEDVPVSTDANFSSIN